MIERPESEEEMMKQLWYAVVGSNGDGIAMVTRRNSQDIQEIKEAIPKLQTKHNCAAIIDDRVSAQRKRKLRVSDIIQWGLTILVMLAVGVPAWIQIL